LILGEASNLVIFNRIDHSFGPIKMSNAIFSNFSLQVKRGEFVTILGPSGCGKSTLLRLIAGLDRPSSGKIEILGDHGHSVRTGYVFQEPNLLPWKTVFQNVTLPMALNQAINSEEIQKAEAVIDRVGLTASKNLYPHQLSGGMKMRVSIARALVRDPELLLLDEPFGALDELNRQRLQEELRMIWESKPLTVVFVTHALTEAAFLSERIIILSHSKPTTILADERVQYSTARNSELRSSLEYLMKIKSLSETLKNWNLK
jgi:NitT/TauT family transport system ATP-binding protein